MSSLRALLVLAVSSTHAARLAVTGAHGYLGAEICWQAALAGHEVRAVGRGAALSSLLPPGCEILDLGDLTDPVAAREAADGMDAVIHTASVFRRCDDMENELGEE